MRRADASFFSFSLMIALIFTPCLPAQADQRLHRARQIFVLVIEQLAPSGKPYTLHPKLADNIRIQCGADQRQRKHRQAKPLGRGADQGMVAGTLPQGLHVHAAGLQGGLHQVAPRTSLLPEKEWLALQVSGRYSAPCKGMLRTAPEYQFVPAQRKIRQLYVTALFSAAAKPRSCSPRKIPS